MGKPQAVLCVPGYSKVRLTIWDFHGNTKGYILFPAATILFFNTPTTRTNDLNSKLNEILNGLSPLNAYTSGFLC